MLAFSDCRVQNLDSIVTWVQSQSPFDLIVYAGDDIRRFVPSDTVNYFERLASLTTFGLAAIIGNDDTGAEGRALIRGRKVYEIHSRPLLIGRFVFLGLEAAPFLKEANPVQGYTIPESEIEAHLERRIHLLRNRIAVLVSHAPPHGCLDEAMRFNRGPIGSEALRSFVLSNHSVALVISGHAHLSGGRSEKLGKSYVFNVASHDYLGASTKLASIDISATGRIRSTWHELKSNLRVAAVCGIGHHLATKLASAGITSVEQLAASTSEQVGSAIGWKPSKTGIFILRAQANVSGKTLFSSRPNLPSAPRIYIDIETDLQSSYCWLVGLITDDGQNVEQCFAPHPTNEREMLQKMLTFLASLPKSSMLHFSETAFDKRVLVKRLQAHSLDIPEALEKSIDCHPRLYHSMAIPGSSFGLKNLATQLGYHFAFPGLDGLQVAMEYERAIRQGKEVSQKLLRYNQDDVLSLRFVIHKIMGLSADVYEAPTP